MTPPSHSYVPTLDALRTLAQSTFDAVLITDALIEAPGPHIVFVNEAFCRMTGYRPEELLGRTPRVFQGPETDRAVLDRLRECLVAGQAFEGSTLNYRKDGRSYLVEWRMNPVHGADGSITHFVSVQRDLTHQVQAEYFSETLLRSLGEGVFGVDLDGRLTFLNPKALEILGYQREDELLGQDAHGAICTQPEGRDGLPIEECLIHRVLHTGGCFDAVEDEFFRADGSAVPIEMYATPVFSPDRRLDGVVVVFSDVSERRQARRSLADQNERLRAVIEGTNAGTWEWNLETGALRVNDILLELVGRARKDVEPLRGEDALDWIHPDDQPLVKQAIEAHLDGRTAMYEAEFRMRHGAGHWVWMLARGKVGRRDPAGRAVLFSGTHLDMTDFRRSEASRLDSEHRYRTLFDGMNDVAFVYPFEERRFGRFVEVNEEACRQLGYSREELLERGPEDILLEEALRFYDRLGRRKLFERRGRDQIETLLIDADGRRMPYEVSLRLIDYDARKMVLAIARNVAERHRWEADLLRSSVVFESSDQGIVIADADSRIVSVNPAFERVTGYSRAEVVGKNPKILQSGKHDRAFYARMWDALFRRGHWQGEVWNRRKDGELFLEWQTINAVRDEQGRVVNYISVFSDITREKRSEEELHFLSHFDPITHLPNWSTFTRRMRESLPQVERAELLYLNIDRFKVINESFGQSVGDEVLRSVAGVLRDLVGNQGDISRFSADEFVVFLPGADPAQAEERAGAILDRLAVPMTFHSVEIALTASVGLASFPADGAHTGDLVSNALSALDQAKQSGRSVIARFMPGMGGSPRDDLILEGALRRAIENNEMVCHYQPQVDLARGVLIGSEVLLRWESPELGMISPGRFIPVAEDSGLIIKLGNWVLLTACEQHRRWREAGHEPGQLAVNISGRQLRSGTLATELLEILEKTDMQPSQLELEITETYLVEDAAILPVLEDLKKVGIRLSVDDFGTGHSSLARLKELPVDKLKIDQAFMRGIPGDGNDEAIVRAIIALGHSLELEVLAEGVETSAEQTFLSELGCDSAQGFYFSRPVPAADYPFAFHCPRQSA
ncbi:MAG: PAS domain S-box protein [Guyparkeria sp.]